MLSSLDHSKESARGHKIDAKQKYRTPTAFLDCDVEGELNRGTARDGREKIL